VSLCQLLKLNDNNDDDDDDDGEMARLTVATSVMALCCTLHGVP